MVSVVLMAGYKPVSDEHKKMLADTYNEHFFFDGYKPLKEFRIRDSSESFVYKPLIQFTMEKLERIDAINDIVIVGDKKKLESKLGDFMDSSRKKYKVVEQDGCIDDKVLDEFGAVRENFDECSLAANGLKAYVNTEAYKRKDYALFVASDSPGTSAKGIFEFIDLARLYMPECSLIFPLVSMNNIPAWRHAFHRKYLFFVNDSAHQYKDSFKTFLTNRDGFRVSSMLYADPFRVDIDKINLCYSLRKMLSHDVRERIKNVLEKFDINVLWRKYFGSKDLSIRDCEEIGGKIMCKNNSNLAIIPFRDIASSFDFDGTVEDQNMIDELLNGKDKLTMDTSRCPDILWTPGIKLA